MSAGSLDAGGLGVGGPAHAGEVEAQGSFSQSDQGRGDGSLSTARQALQSEHSSESVTTAPPAGERDQTYPDGRPIPEYTAAAATYMSQGQFVHCWPPAGAECKFPLGSSRERLVNALTAQSGELVQISIEFEECSDVARFKGRVGRLTQPYGDAYWGALFEGEKREQCFHCGEGLYMLAYVHQEGKEFNDIQKPLTNGFGKLIFYTPEPPSEPSTRPSTIPASRLGSSRPMTGIFGGLLSLPE